MRLLAGITIAVVLWPLTVQAEGSCRAESGDRLVPLVELYTSEGCDSCPAADRWLSTHFPADRSDGAVALAFHVDYWDRLGWKDRFARPVYTARQHQTMRTNRATFVYTPQVVLQGRDFTGWRRGAPASAITTASARTPPARIAVHATIETSSIVVRTDATLMDSPRGETMVALAYADSRLSSDVRAGENRGVKLTHDHVVRAFETRPLNGTTGSYNLRMPRPAEAGEHPMIVAFVQEVGSGEILQALALPLERCQ